MNSDTSVKKNLLYQSVYEGLIIILPLMTSPYIARVLGAEQLGIFSYTFSIAYYFQIFGMLGLKFYGNRSIARVRDNKAETDRTYSELLTLHIVMSLLVMAFYVVYVLEFSAPYKLFFIIQGLMVASSIFDVSWLFFGLEKFKLMVMRNSIIKISSVACVFIFVSTVSDLWKYVLIMASAQFVSQIIIFFMAGKYVRFSFPRPSAMLRHIKPLLILFIPIVSLSLYKYMDKIMLGTMGR